MSIQMEAETSYRRIASLYARAMDRNQAELFDTIFTPDAVLVGPGFRMEGIDQIRGVPAMLPTMFVATQHLMHNQLLFIDGDQADGETYCSAIHIKAPEAEGAPNIADAWALRYVDRLRIENGEWKICLRTLVLDWTEQRPVTLSAPQS